MQEMINKSSDILDQAADLTERERTYLLEEHRKRVENSRIKAKGSCYNCEEPLEADLIFCDIDCRDDYEYVMKRRKVNSQ